MQTRTLQHTDLHVSRACFGTMTFGSQVDEPAALRIVDRCVEAGVNFFDTANVYNGGASEVITGKALKGRRDKVILASKVRGKAVLLAGTYFTKIRRRGFNFGRRRSRRDNSPTSILVHNWRRPASHVPAGVNLTHGRPGARPSV